MYLNALRALIDDPGVDIIICIAFFAPPSITNELLKKMSAVIRKAEKPILVFTQYGPNTDRYLKDFFKEGVVGFSSIYRAVRAARYLVERGLILEQKEKSNET
jgi:acyl-CoA synthetase (NDP forming)